MARWLLILAVAVLGLAVLRDGKPKQRKPSSRLLAWYPGRYDNVEQAKADASAGREPHAALELNIVRIYAPRVGDYAFYFQESAADDPRRVFTALCGVPR